MFLRRRFPHALSIVMIIGGLFISLFILRKMKYLYDSNQKYHRLESYKQYMEEISDYMHHVEVSANKSANNLHRLNSGLQRQQQQLVIGMSTDKSTGRWHISVAQPGTVWDTEHRSYGGSGAELSSNLCHIPADQNKDTHHHQNLKIYISHYIAVWISHCLW